MPGMMFVSDLLGDRVVIGAPAPPTKKYGCLTLAGRGVASLLIDQPGTGEALRLHSMPATAHSERWATPVLKHLLNRADGIPTQIGIAYARRTFEGPVNSPKRELEIFTAREGGVEHDSLDNMPCGADFIADWVAEPFQELRAST